MLEVSEHARDPTTELDEPVDRLGTTVAGTTGIEVRQDRLLPLPQRPAQPGDLRDRARLQSLNHPGGEPLSPGERVLEEHVTHVLGALVGDLDTDVILVRDERRLQTGPLSLGEAFPSGPQQVADAVERITLPTPMSGCLLLDTPTDVIDSTGGAWVRRYGRLGRRSS